MTGQVDRVAVDAAVHAAFQRLQVFGFYADPPHFQDYVGRWMAEFGPRLRVRATGQRPTE
jgi:glutathione S-transferase